MSDCEIAEFYDTREVFGRKQHSCVECMAPIHKGELHLVIVSKYQGDFEQYRQHLLCCQACEWYRGTKGECLYFGELFECWTDGYGDWSDKSNADILEFRSIMAKIIKRERKDVPDKRRLRMRN